MDDIRDWRDTIGLEPDGVINHLRTERTALCLADAAPVAVLFGVFNHSRHCCTSSRRSRAKELLTEREYNSMRDRSCEAAEESQEMNASGRETLAGKRGLRTRTARFTFGVTGPLVITFSCSQGVTSTAVATSSDRASESAAPS